MVDDDDLEVFEIEVDGKVKRFIFCSECIEDIKAMHDSVEEYLKSIYMKKGDKVNTTIAEGTFKFQGYDSQGRAILKQKGLPPMIVPASTVHPEGVIRFENNQGSKRVVFV